jgi:hypothetical protein
VPTSYTTQNQDKSLPLVRIQDKTVSFPDGMSPEEISGVIQRDKQRAEQFADFVSRPEYYVQGANPVEGATSAVLATPIIGDIAGLAMDADMYMNDPGSRNWFNYLFTAMSVLPAIPAASQVKKAAEKLQFLHNTSAEKLARIDNMGGMPMPSLAVTKGDVPFDSYGDITLVGDPSNFNPAKSVNDLFSADAYTVRAPAPVRMAKKNAWRDFQKDIEPLEKDGVYTSEVVDAMISLETKKNISEYDYDKLLRWSEQNGVDVNKYLEPDEFFISNPDRDRYTGSAKLKPYTAEEVAKWMKRRGGANQEGGMASTGFGAQRAATTERIKSYRRAKELADTLKPKSAIDEIKKAQEESFFRLVDDLKGSYEYDANGFRYFDEVSDFIQMSERMGVDRAAREVGFRDIPDYVLEDIAAYKNMLRSSPTEYFESKPRRVVDLSEFKGALIPSNAPDGVREILSKHGISDVREYTDEASRLNARAAFEDLMFSVGLPAAIAGPLIYGEQQGQDESEMYQ